MAPICNRLVDSQFIVFALGRQAITHTILTDNEQNNFLDEGKQSEW